MGRWEDDSSAEGWAEYHRVLTEWIERGNPDTRVGGGESYRDMQARFLPWSSRCAAHAADDWAVLLIAHGGLYRCMLPLVLGNVSAAFALAHTLEGNAAYVLSQVRPQRRPGLPALERRGSRGRRARMKTWWRAYLASQFPSCARALHAAAHAPVWVCWRSDPQEWRVITRRSGG